MKLDKIAVASGNKGKIKEIKQIFTGAETVSMSELGFDGDIPETGTTFKENALIKAKFIAEKFNLPALADDSGLCVDNRRFLLEKLGGCADRRARFESAVCLYFPDGKYFFGEGATYGSILFEDTGGNGFGYDCLFYSDDLKKSFGIASAEEKNAVSHRYRALCDLRSKL